MKTFAELGIKSKTLSGVKIPIEEVIDQKIKIEDYRIADSKFGKRESRCLHLQIEYNNEKRVIFTGSTVLMDILERIPEGEFPFEATIIKERDWYKFI